MNLSFQLMINLFKLGLGLLTVSFLSGCLITSPYWNQEFSNHSSAIPLQAWTNHNGHPVRVECSKAFHGGLYPPSSGSWSHVTNLYPQNPGVLDPSGTRVYSAGAKMVLPASCWRAETTSAGLRYFAAVRMIQTKPKVFGSGLEDVTFSTFDKTGLECLGREIGKDASWFGYAGEGCAKTYSGSTTEIPFVIFRAKN